MQQIVSAVAAGFKMLSAIQKTSLVVCKYLRDDESREKIATAFDFPYSQRVTSSSIQRLIHMMYEQAFFSEGTLIATVINLNRFRVRVPLSKYNVMSVLQICLDVSCKGLDDICPSLRNFARKGQNMQELVRLERIFCETINYNVIGDSEDCVSELVLDASAPGICNQ